MKKQDEDEKCKQGTRTDAGNTKNADTTADAGNGSDSELAASDRSAKSVFNDKP